MGTLCLSDVLPSLGEGQPPSAAYVYHTQVPVTGNMSYHSTNDPNSGTEPPKHCSSDLVFLVHGPLWETVFLAALHEPPWVWKNKGLWEGVTCQVPRKIAYLQKEGVRGGRKLLWSQTSALSALADWGEVRADCWGQPDGMLLGNAPSLLRAVSHKARGNLPRHEQDCRLRAKRKK